MSQNSPMSLKEIQGALVELRSGINLDPPLAEQQTLAKSGLYERLIELHRWLAVGIAMERTKAQFDLNDFHFDQLSDDCKTSFLGRVNRGVSGLQKAVEKWNPDSGYKFGSCASWWIRQAMSQDIPKGR